MPTNPDGQCVSRRLVVGLDEELQCARRDGLPLNRRLAEMEQAASDELRESVVNQTKKDWTLAFISTSIWGPLTLTCPA